MVPIRVYRWHPARRDGAFDQLVAGIAERRFDAVSFTSAPAVAATLMRAVELGIEDRVLVGPAHRRPRDVRRTQSRPVRWCGWECRHKHTERMRLGALARHITDELPLLQAQHGQGGRSSARDPRHLCTGRRRRQGTVPGRNGHHPRFGTPPRHGHVQRHELLNALPGGSSDTHAVETAVLRLRTALGDKHIVSTVVKRGYRLTVDDTHPAGVA